MIALLRLGSRVNRHRPKLFVHLKMVVLPAAMDRASRRHGLPGGVVLPGPFTLLSSQYGANDC